MGSTVVSDTTVVCVERSSEVSALVVAGSAVASLVGSAGPNVVITGTAVSVTVGATVSEATVSSSVLAAAGDGEREGCGMGEAEAEGTGVLDAMEIRWKLPVVPELSPPLLPSPLVPPVR